MKTQPPLFKVVLVEPEMTLLGFEWLEVIAIMPFRAERVQMVCDDDDCKETHYDPHAWAYASFFLCRSENGIIQIAEDDLMHELYEGIYVETGTSDKEVQRIRKVREKRDRALAKRRGGLQ